MKLKKITIDHFRCFEHLEVEFTAADESDTSNSAASLMKSAGTTIFVGNNGAGKTAILDAVVYLLNVMFSRFPNVPTKTLKVRRFFSGFSRPLRFPKMMNLLKIYNSMQKWNLTGMQIQSGGLQN